MTISTPDALLRDVTRAGFVPPPAPLPADLLLAEEARLRGEVDEFAAGFFATPVAPRRQRWQALSAECAFSPPLTARLAALQPALGLELGLGDIGNPRTAQLASHVAGLFVLAPAARAAQRQAVLRGMQADNAGWEEIARQLQAVAPAVAALEPVLLASVLGSREQQQRLARVREKRQPAPGHVARAAALAPKAPAAKGSGGRAVGWGAVLLVGLVVRVCIGFGSHSSSPPNVPRFEPQQFQQHQIDPKVFEDIDRLQRLNRDMEEEERRKKQAEDWQRLIQDNQDNNDRVGPGRAKPRGEENPFAPPRGDDRPGRSGLDTRRER